MKLHFAAALAAMPFCVLAQESPPTSLAPVVVTATRSEQSSVRLPVALTQITRADIEASGAVHVVDVLRSFGGAQVTDFYGDGTRAQIDLRGFGDSANANTLILVDGRRLNNPDIATPDLNSISLKDIERIEILPGSAGALYGDQAVGGVVNIITRIHTADEAQIEIGGGSYGAHRAQVNGNLARGNASFRLSAETRHSDNYRDHNDLDYHNLLGRADYAWNNGKVFAEASWIREDLLTPGALFADEVRANRRQSAARFANDFSDTDTRVLRTGLEQSLGSIWRLDAEVTERRSDGTFRLGSFGLATQDSFQNRTVRAFNPRVSANIPLKSGDVQLTLGSDLQRADYALTSQLGTQSNRQDQTDLYGQAIVPLTRALDVTVGMRYARVENDVEDGFTFVEPTRFSDHRTAGQAGLAWRPLDPLRLFLRYDRNYRFAKVDEFTNAGAPPASNFNPLQTQTGDSWETGAEWARQSISLRLTLYRLDSLNEITFDPATFSNINLDRTRRDGVIVGTRWQASDRLTLSAAAQYVDAEVRAGVFEGNAVPLVASRTGKLTADLGLPLNFRAYAELLATGKRSFAGDYDNSLGKLPGHAVANLALGWRWKQLSVQSRIDNLLDHEYSEYGASGTDPTTYAEAAAFMPSPGRRFWLSFAYSL